MGGEEGGVASSEDTLSTHSCTTRYFTPQKHRAASSETIFLLKKNSERSFFCVCL